ncbi:MAG: response regulator [Candidatus Omnitrophica bacterium]|nr:response regulator [Candidatus Omnitrophota bacterium]
MSKLLIVDDEIDVREFAKRFFKKRGIDVSIASGGDEALNIIGRHRPDLVLLDIQMEGLSGMEVLRKLREEKNDIKVIMVTGAEDPSIIDEANNLGVKGYIHKPLILEELEKIVMKELKISVHAN